MQQAESPPWWREVTGYQWLVLLVAWLGRVVDVMDTALINLQLAPFDWRWLFVMGILLALITILIRMRVKEPETWVRHHESGPAVTHGGPLREQFGTSHWRRRALVACLLGIVGIAGAWNTSYRLPNLVKAASSRIAEEAVRVRVSYATMTLHIGTLLGALVFPLLCERFGRRPAPA